MNSRQEEVGQTSESTPPDPTKAGYSKILLERLNSRIKLLSPKVAIKEGSIDAISKASGEMEGRSEEEKIRFELAAVTAHFIPEVWKNMLDWLRSNGVDLAVPANDKLVTLSEEEVVGIIKGRPLSPDNLVQMVTTKVEDFFVDEWTKEMEQKLQNPEFKQTKEGQFYARWQELLKQRTKFLKQTLTPESHLKVGMQQANDIVWSLFRTIPKIYQKQYPDRALEPQQHEQLVRNANILVSSIASCNPLIARKIFQIINPSPTVNPFHVYNNYALDFFKFLEGANGQKYLEFDPTLFKSVEQFLETSEAKQEIIATIRCPALYVTGRNGRNLIADFYDWNASLYLKYCIDKPRE